MFPAQRILAVLALPTSAAGISKYGGEVVQFMTGNALFPAPTPALSTFSTHLGALNAAELVVATRAKGSVPARDAALLTVVNDLTQLKGYVQGVANADPENAAHIIQSSGMKVKRVTPFHKPALALKQGPLSGTLLVVAKAAAKRASYEWETSLDEKSWTALPPTLQAKTNIAGLAPASLVYVRFRAVTKTGASDWSAPVSIIVK